MNKDNNSIVDINDTTDEGYQVAVVGIGFRLPLGKSDPFELWEQLLNGYDHPNLIDREKLKSFDPMFFGIGSNEKTDPHQTLILKCIWEALEDALIDPFDIRGTNASVYTTYSLVENQNDGGVKQTYSNGISHCFDLCGDSIIIDSSCSLNAIKLGYQSIKSGLTKLSIAGSVTSNTRENGESEGCCVVVMKSLKEALADGNNIYYVIDSTSSNVNEPLYDEYGTQSTNQLLLSLVKCCLMFKHQCFEPIVQIENANLNSKTSENENKPVTISITNSSLNVCLILSEFMNNIKNNQQAPRLTQQYLIPFSADSIKSLEKYQSLIKKYEIDFNEFVKQQLHKPTKLLSRSVVMASNWDEFDEALVNQIKTKTNNKQLSNLQIAATTKEPTVVFVFCGQGTHYPTMAKQLYETEPIFKNSLDKINTSFSKHYGYSILDKLRSLDENDVTSLYNAMSLSVIGTIQVSLFEFYKQHWGIKPSFIIGHSFGEFVAAHCSGMIDLDTLSRISYISSVEQSKTAGSARLLSINIGKDEYFNKYASKYPTFEIACYNSSSAIVIGGDFKSLNEISTELKKDGILSSLVGSSPFHTPRQRITKDAMLNIKFDSKAPVIPMFSTVTTNLFGHSTTTSYDNEYYSEILCQPVKFEQTISNLYKHIEKEHLCKDIIFIEIAPHPTLSNYLKQMVPTSSNEYFKNASISVYSPLSKKNPNDLMEINKMISQMYCKGYNGINFKCQFDNINCSNGNLPLYQWYNEQDDQTIATEPQNDTILNDEELVLHKISELLSIDIDKVNQDLTLIKYGADSLQIVQLKNYTQSQFQVPNIITIQQIQNNTIGTIIKLVKTTLDKLKLEPKIEIKQTIQERIEYWKNEMKLDDSMIQKVGIKSIGPNDNNDKRILLTGSTGYFGAYLLSGLLQLSTCSIVYCLIRNKSKSLNPIDEIISNLKYHQLYDQLDQHQLLKISAIIGDLTLNKFGISDGEFNKLSKNVNLIINSGADIDLESDYQTCKLVNVNGVSEIIKLSISQYPPIKIVSFSTYFIFINQEYNKDHGEFDEETVLPLIENIDNLKKGYLQSKVVSEYMLKKSSESFNIPIMIIRLPSIYSNPQTGIGSKFDLPQLLLQCCYVLGHYPILSNVDVCISSITWTALNSMNLILNDNCWSNNSTKVYGVYGESQQNILNSMERLIGKSKAIPLEEWKQMVLNSTHKSCILYKTFHSFGFEHLKIDNRFTISNNTKSLLISMNDYGSHDNWKITDQMIINNFNYSFK